VLPGKQYSADEVLRILLHGKWLILLPFVLGVLASVAVSRWLPDKYRSESLIVAAPQRISDLYVKPSVSAGLEDRLPTISQQVLSRARLERIIHDLDLYSDLRRRKTMDDVVQRMRTDIEVKIEAGESARTERTERLLRISYVAPRAGTAQQVAERLASLIIDENFRDRENLAQDTNAFLQTQLEDAKSRLVAHEKKLEAYRRRYSGELPTQAAANLQVIQNTQLQLQALSEATDRARERRLLVERQLADLQSPDPLVVSAVSTSPGPSRQSPEEETTAHELEAARARLRALQARDKPNHPDVRILQHTIRDLEAKLEAESKAPRESLLPQKSVTPAEAAREKRTRELIAEREGIDRELQDKEQQDRHLRSVVAAYQAKLDAQPTRESDLVELMRDYTTLQSTYQDLLAKREQSKMAANLERKAIGEQFRILEPALVPERPFSPNRLLIHLAGAGAGLAVGLLLVALLEYRDSTLRSEDDVTRLFNLPVFALVPVMTSLAERRTLRRRRNLSVGLATVMVFLGTVAALALWSVWRVRL
jgi:polysaccharide chain length determinant protein (PEP-CTERM system associated)